MCVCIYIYTVNKTDSLCCTAETNNIVNQLYSNKNFKKGGKISLWLQQWIRFYLKKEKKELNMTEGNCSQFRACQELLLHIVNLLENGSNFPLSSGKKKCGF